MHRLSLVALIAILAACSTGEPSPRPNPTPTSPSVPPWTPGPRTAQPTPTNTPPPTATAWPTNTPEQALVLRTGNRARNVVLIGRIEQHTRLVFVRDSSLYVTDNTGIFRALDLSDPTRSAPMGFYAIPGSPEDLVVVGGYAYMADGGRYGLQIIDVSDPAAPIEAGFLATPGPAFGIAVVGQYVYIAEGYHQVEGELKGGGLRIVNVADPAAPAELSFYDTPGQALSVAVADQYAYVGDAEAGLRVIDVSDPSNPKEVGSYATQGPVSGVAVASRYAYITDGWGGSLRIVDVADPTAPAEVGFYYTFGLADNVTVTVNYAYVTGGDKGLYVLDVSRPAAPMEAGFFEIPGHAMDVAAIDHQIYIAAGEAGLLILRFSPPRQAAIAAPPTPAPLPPAPPAGLFQPEGDFAALWTSDAGFRQTLGWARSPQPARVATAFQPFEGGVMIWREDERLIYVLFRDGTWTAFDDTWTEDQPAFDPRFVAPAGRFQPIRGFGKVWRSHRDVRGRLGWALEPEVGRRSPVQPFEHGVLIGIADKAYALVEVAGRPMGWYRR